MKKKVLYLDMDNVLVDFSSGIKKISEEMQGKFKGDFSDVPGIFSLMTPLEGAIEAFQELSQIFDTYILSTAPWKNPSAWRDKLLWVKKYLKEPAKKRLILSHNKNLNAGDFLVDDRLKNGADKFQGEHIHFGTNSFPDWNSVLNYLRTK
ncbi:MAG: 5' nucleotidase, NT5C type, partial [Alphaproteobacteria bacterium]